MKYLDHIVSITSAAALAFALGMPVAVDSAAYASGFEASASASASSSSAPAAESSSASSAEEAHEEAGGSTSSPGTSGGSEQSGSDSQADSGESSGNSKASHKGAQNTESASTDSSNSSKASKGSAKKHEKSSKSGKSKKAKKKKSKTKTEKAKASGENPKKYAKKLPALVSKLSVVPDEFGKAKDIAKAYKAKLAKLDKKKAALQKEQQRAQNVLDEMNQELSDGASATLAMVLTGRADFDSIDSRSYLLQKVADGSSQCIERTEKALKKLEKRRTKLQKQEKAEVKAAAKEHSAATEQSLAKGNALAAKIEQNVSLMKYAEPELTKEHASLRKEALAAAAEWYEFVDALAGNDGVLTFGTGADFALTKKAFVKKWGEAIDAFYAEYYPNAPLKGHGAEMAAAAWEHKIDPRLCAAVSIVESTGGQYCIKPHNAWGWGAADSDPYGGASSWDSWADAIAAWHEGIANSTTGLATASTLEELGEIYCSTLDWAAKVSEDMQQISAEVE